MLPWNDRQNVLLLKYLNKHTHLSLLFLTVKAAKASFGLLRTSASNLDAATKDSCNRSQMSLITGEKCEDCEEKEPKLPGRRPSDCEDAGPILSRLISMPDKLSKDIDIILNAAADVIGIQTFTNITSLSQRFSPTLKTGAKAFDDFLNTTIAARNTDRNNAMAALATSSQNLTDASFSVYNASIDVKATDGLKEFLCNHETEGCDCIENIGDDRLKECKSDINNICREVTRIYSGEASVDNIIKKKAERKANKRKK